MERPKKIQELLKKASIPPKLLNQINVELTALFQELEEKDTLLKKQTIHSESSDTKSIASSNPIKEIATSPKPVTTSLPSGCLYDENQLFFFQEIINTSPSSVAFIDKNYCYRFISKQYNKYLGIDIQHLKGKHIQNIIGRKAFKQTAKALMDQVFSGQKKVSETLLKEIAEKEIYVRITSKPAYDKQGNIIGAYVFGEHITELKQKEKELAKSEKQIRTLFNNIREPIIELDLAGYAKNYNKAAEKFFDIQPNTPFFIPGIIHPDDYEIVGKAFDLLEKQGYYESQQYKIILPNEKLLHIDVSSVATYDKQGKLSGSIDTIRDVTEKVKIQQALKASESKYKTLVENNYFGIVQTDLNGNLTYSSPRADAIMGYSNDHPTKGINFAKYIEPSEIPRMLKQLQLLKEGKILVDNFRGKFQREDGKKLCIEGTSVLLKDESGKPFGLNIVFDDVTEKVKVEESLKASEERYKILVESSPSGISLNSLTGKRLYVSRRSAELYGYDSPEEMLQRSTPDDIHPDYISKVKQDMKKVVELNGKIISNIYKGIKKDGSEFYYEANGRIIKENGEKQILIIYNDVTARVEAEQELEEKNEELERYINYSLQLENFAHLASHDLREPLINIQSISFLLEMEEENNLSDSGKQYLSYIQTSSKRMEQLLSELLEYSTIGKYSNPQKVDCNLLINSTIKDLSVKIQQKQIELNIATLPIVNGHQKELRSLFQNLISNAIKYRRKDLQSKINVSYEENSTHWKFSFKDNGIGIEPKNHEKIFLIYKRLNNQLQDEKSTGLGLAYCKKVVELHQGKIWIESELNKGTTVFFTLQKTLPTK